MKQHHQHIADTFPGKSGSPFQAFHKKRRALNSALFWIAALAVFVIGGLAVGL